MEQSSKGNKTLYKGGIVAVIALTAVAVGLTYLAREPQLDSLRNDNDELNVAVASLQDEVLDLSESLGAYHKIAAYQEEMADSIRVEKAAFLGDYFGNRLVITEGVHEVLPETIADAETQGYSLVDKVDSGGKLTEAACFAHEGVRHYAKLDPKITNGKEWHGAPFLLAYKLSSEKLMGIVLESETAQPAGPWEYHAKGHPGMEFPHWSLHIWFTDPPKNLDLSGHSHTS